MRIIIPAEIEKLADIIEPYMVMNKEKTMYILREDAPASVVEAKKKYDYWWEQNHNQ